MFTIGHSNLPIESFLRALRKNEVRLLVDVRTMPRSRHNPQFNSDVLEVTLREVGIAYRHAPELGGLRKTSRESINTAWKNASFRGYADYMQTPEFAAAIAKLRAEPDLTHTTVMCAEAVPWRCHRSLIADAMLARGVAVENIFVTIEGKSTRKAAALTPFARVEGERVWYPALDEPVRGLFDQARIARD
jgi:uncharacterized protein (DUF488 family)